MGAFRFRGEGADLNYPDKTCYTESEVIAILPESLTPILDQLEELLTQAFAAVPVAEARDVEHAAREAIRERVSRAIVSARPLRKNYRQTADMDRLTEIVARWNNGEDQVELAAEFFITHQRVNQILRQAERLGLQVRLVRKK